MKKTLAILITAAAALVAAVSCGTTVPLTMTKAEAALINGSPDIMRILSVDNEADLAVLRTGSSNFNVQDLNTAEYAKLADKLVKTLQSTDGGVGLAAPQVGINRRVVAVMRVDKEGEPIEVYPNIRIEEMRGEMEPGGEGCLSVPDQRGDVMRYRDITIVYTDINSDRLDQPREIREDVSGFAAVIFQHEVDHLDGIIFTDKLQ
ncbi:MAG: peptide deformylase [Bacteroidia bacterium]|nr:peptide deformylase [Bacteroidia bacterium]